MRRAKALALEEAYRPLISTEEGVGAVPLPAIQAILRRQIALAMKGNGPARRAVNGEHGDRMGIGDEHAVAAAEQRGRETAADNDDAEISYNEAVRRVAFFWDLRESSLPKPLSAARRWLARWLPGAELRFN